VTLPALGIDEPEHEAWLDRIWERLDRELHEGDGKIAQRPSAMRNSRRNPLLFQEHPAPEAAGASRARH